jgi:hypothetical protein
MTISHPTTIGMRNAELSTWLERKASDADVLALRAKLIAEKPTHVMALMPQGEDAVMELGHTLCSRDGWVQPTTPAETLSTLGLMYVEDLCILTKQGDAPYTLSAGVLCFPNRWHLTEKIGKPMIEVHAPVPEYAEKLAPQVDFFLDRLRPDRCFKRSNWGIASTPDLHLPDPVAPVNPATDVDFYVRYEGQSFLKLPKTNAVVFSIHTNVVPWCDVPPEDQDAVLSFAKSLGPDWLAYKSIV